MAASRIEIETDDEQSATLTVQAALNKSKVARFLKQEIRTEVFAAVAVSMLVLLMILWGYLYLHR